MKRPDKPHVHGYEDEEDCAGYYDPFESERRRCPMYWRQSLPNDPCRMCREKYEIEEATRLQAIQDAMTPEEKTKMAKFLAGLRELY